MSKILKGWLKQLSIFISQLIMLKKAFDNVKIEKWKVKSGFSFSNSLPALSGGWLKKPLGLFGEFSGEASFLASMILETAHLITYHKIS